MTDEVIDQSAPEVESTATETTEVQTETEQTEQVEQELAEVDIDGEKYQVPPKLKDAVLRQADYTRKTQEVAEQRKAIEAERQAIVEQQKAVQESAQRQQQHIRAYAQREAMAASLAQLNQVNLFQLNQQDPVKAQEILIQRTQVENALRQIDGQISQLDQKAAIEKQQAIAKQTDEAAKYLAKEINGWAPGNDVDVQITRYANQIGVRDLTAIAHTPALGVALHKAMLFDQKLAAAKEQPKPKTEATPIKTVTSRSGGTKSPSEMSDKEFNDWRRRQIAQRR